MKTTTRLADYEQRTSTELAGMLVELEDAREQDRRWADDLLVQRRRSRSLDEEDCCSVHGLVAVPWKRWVYLGMLTHEHEMQPRLYLSDAEQKLGDGLERGLAHDE